MDNAAPPGAAPPPVRRPHRFLARTFSSARWSEYDRLLAAALELGWTAMALEDWVAAGGPQGRVLILRHDVDQHPATALKMASIEARHGLHATWYFRWRTSAPAAIEAIRELGGGVGLHYETLTRIVLERGLTSGQVDAELIAEAREQLRGEIAEFARRFGPLQSICAHGDTRVPGVSNQALVRGIPASQIGVGFDANIALSRHRLALWLTDRASTDGRWKDGIAPLAALEESSGPILCLTHPNNWCSGASLWLDRIRASLLSEESAARGRRKRGLHTGSDRVPSPALPAVEQGQMVSDPMPRSAPSVRGFEPISQALRREIVRHYYDVGKTIATHSGLRTLDTNSNLAESRAQTLEGVLRRAGVTTLQGRDVVDLGCGFGALALVFAARGAHVVALDPNEPRLRVGQRVAEAFGIQIKWLVGSMEEAELGVEQLDVALMNNSLCYLLDMADRQEALARTLRALRPGGMLVVRNPARFRLRDQFTGLPLLGTLPPGAARRMSDLVSPGRSDVRLLSGRAAARELRRAGFVNVARVPVATRGAPLRGLGRYQHLIARRPFR